MAQGYAPQKPELAPFILPSVPVTSRTGQVLRFGKEQFAVGDYRRAPGTNIPFVSSRYESSAYMLEQETLAWEVPIEILSEAANGPAAIDLRAIETRNLVGRLQNSYEKTVTDAVTDPSIYEPGLAFATHSAFATANTSGTVNWSDATAKSINDIIRLRRLVADQIGIRPNSAVIGTAVFDTLLTSPEILDRIKYTNADSITEDMIASYFGLDRGLMVSQGRYLAPNGRLMPTFPENGILLFYSASSADSGMMPASGDSMANPSFGYTYMLQGAPSVAPEYEIKERRVVRAEMTMERSPHIVAMGETGLASGGALILDLFA